MRNSDWSSDVCSSDLNSIKAFARGQIAYVRIGIGVDDTMLDPRTSFRPQFAKINGLQCEKAQLAGFVFRQEFLLTHDTEIAHEHLRPYGAFPTVLLDRKSTRLNSSH